MELCPNNTMAILANNILMTTYKLIEQSAGQSADRAVQSIQDGQ